MTDLGFFIIAGLVIWTICDMKNDFVDFVDTIKRKIKHNDEPKHF